MQVIQVKTSMKRQRMLACNYFINPKSGPKRKELLPSVIASSDAHRHTDTHTQTEGFINIRMHLVKIQYFSSDAVNKSQDKS